jgi:pyridoxal phosphate enzyme (YggS family)
MSDPAHIARNLAEVKERMAAAARPAGRDPAAVRLVAVTKGHPAEAILTLVELGVSHIGESYVDEALPKQMALGQGASVKWHMIGHVQSRKAQAVAAHFSLVHSVDSIKLAERLDRFAGQAGSKLAVLLECNVSAEASKHGWPVADKAAFLDEAQRILNFEHLDLQGLMSMAPYGAGDQAARPYFELTRALRDELAARSGRALPELSMGMSGDYEAAILEGATLVRIGTALLGERG